MEFSFNISKARKNIFVFIVSSALLVYLITQTQNKISRFLSDYPIFEIALFFIYFIIVVTLIFRIFQSLSNQKIIIYLGDEDLLIPNYYLGVKRIPINQIYSIENINLKNKNVAAVLGVKNKDRFFVDKNCFQKPEDFEVFKSEIKSKIFKNFNDESQQTIRSISLLQESKFTIATISICIICISVFIFEVISAADETLLDGFILLGAGSKGFVEQHEYYRLFSSPFIHVNFFHLMLNLFVLAVMGELLEKVISPARFINIFLVSCASGFLFFICFSYEQAGVGASGGIFGFWGAYLFLKLKYENYLPGSVNAIPLKKLLWLLLIEFIIEIFIIKNVGYSAHFGGFLAGFVYLYLVPLGMKLETVDHPTIYEKALCAILVSAYAAGLSYFLLLYYGLI